MDISELLFGEYSHIPLLVFLIAILIVIAKFVGKFPPQLPPAEHPRRNLFEVGIYFVFFFVYLALTVFILIPILNFLLGNLFYIGLILNTIILFALLIYLRYRDHWTSKDLGLNSKVSSWPVVFTSISLYILLGIYNYLRLMHNNLLPEQIAWYSLLILFYSNAFLEEITFRGFMQTKLEQALNQKKALLYQAILFTLIHIPANLLRLSLEGNFEYFCWYFAFQFVHGLIYGLLFMKTRNLWASVICHYLNNWMGSLIILFI